MYNYHRNKSNVIEPYRLLVEEKTTDDHPTTPPVQTVDQQDARHQTLSRSVWHHQSETDNLVEYLNNQEKSTRNIETELDEHPLETGERFKSSVRFSR